MVDVLCKIQGQFFNLLLCAFYDMRSLWHENRLLPLLDVILDLIWIRLIRLVANILSFWRFIRLPLWIWVARISLVLTTLFILQGVRVSSRFLIKGLVKFTFLLALLRAPPFLWYSFLLCLPTSWRRQYLFQIAVLLFLHRFWLWLSLFRFHNWLICLFVHKSIEIKIKSMQYKWFYL